MMAKETKKSEGAATETAGAAAETQQTAEKGTPDAAERKQETSGAVVYVGPPVKGTVLHSTFTIFADGIPEEYRQHQTFKHLFVPPARLDQARKEIGKTGSLYNTYYKRAVKGQQQATADTSPSLGIETTKKASER